MVPGGGASASDATSDQIIGSASAGSTLSVAGGSTLDVVTSGGATVAGVIGS